MRRTTDQRWIERMRTDGVVVSASARFCGTDSITVQNFISGLKFGAFSTISAARGGMAAVRRVENIEEKTAEKPESDPEYGRREQRCGGKFDQHAVRHKSSAGCGRRSGDVWQEDGGDAGEFVEPARARLAN